NNRYADVSALSFALTEVVTHSSNELQALGASSSSGRLAGPELLETRRGDMPNLPPPPMPPSASPPLGSPNLPGMGAAPMGAPNTSGHMPQHMQQPMMGGAPQQPMQPYGSGAMGGPPMGQAPNPHFDPMGSMSGSGAGHQAPVQYPQASVSQIHQHGGAVAHPPAAKASNKWVWWVVGLLALGATVGAVLALVLR
ncbi:MAG: hypothetical protein JNL83_16305, partial [Myxococcales bacterium]|nr:hypothetical protein [Myxococcales bacterium]